MEAYMWVDKLFKVENRRLPCIIMLDKAKLNGKVRLHIMCQKEGNPSNCNHGGQKNKPKKMCYDC